MSGSDDCRTNENSVESEAGGDQGGRRPLLVTIAKAAELLAIGRSSVYRLIEDGELATIHIGRSVRISSVELEEFVRQRTVPG